MHFVISNIFHGNRFECSGSDMQGQIGNIYTAIGDL